MTAREAFDRSLDKLTEDALKDPAGLRRQVEAELLAENGQEWMDANRKALDAEWEQAGELLGYDFGGAAI